MKRKKKILLSFVGTNDAGKLISSYDGAILTSLQNDSFDEVILLWNEAKIESLKYSEVVTYLTKEIKKRKLAESISNYKVNLTDVTDHNEIYKELKKITDRLDKKDNIKYTAAISSGTPAMQVAWILLAESGDFSISNPLKLIKTKDPKFGKSKNIHVKLSTGLPRIVGLTNELAEVKQDLIPMAVLSIEKGELTIGGNAIKLAPIEFCYYRYFAEKVIENKGLEKFSGYTISLNFMKQIQKFHEESFYDFYSGREELEEMIKKEHEQGIGTFRGNISKLNSKIQKGLDNETLVKTFQIVSEGKRGAMFYGLRVSKKKLKIN